MLYDSDRLQELQLKAMTEPPVDAIGSMMPPSMATILMTYYNGSRESNTDVYAQHAAGFAAHAAAAFCTAADELDSVMAFAARTMPQHLHDLNPMLQHTTEKYLAISGFMHVLQMAWRVA